MLISLHVKNMALIREEEISFGPGLNILTGETGAGKSIIIGSISVALGSESFKNYVPENVPYALVELTFDTTRSAEEKLRTLDLPSEEGCVTISRRYQGGRTISRINGETVPLAKVKQIAAMLIDIHGQNQHQSLLHPAFHRMLLDRFAAQELGNLPQQCFEEYAAYQNISAKIRGMSMDDSTRMKQIDLLSYEIKEIENAAVVPGEDEELEKKYRRMEHGQKIMDILAEVKELVNVDSGAGDGVGRAAGAMSAIADFDETLGNLNRQLLTIEDELNDFDRQLADYMDDFSYDEQEFYETSQRLDLLNHLKSKYGRSLPEVLAYMEKDLRELDQLQNHEAYLEDLRKQQKQAMKKLIETCEKIRQIRRKYGAALSEKIRQALVDLNFLDVQFKTSIEPLDAPTADGADEVVFMISTNPGMPLRPIWSVASGGELSRIMLAIKSVMADQDEIGTLIFDEIDAGISGRTAQKVSEKMNVIARSHQVICITHLAQIAAMADIHFEIAKHVENGQTYTGIRQLSPEESVQELSRILGGVQITDTVRRSAREMLEMAKKLKQEQKK